MTNIPKMSGISSLVILSLAKLRNERLRVAKLAPAPETKNKRESLQGLTSDIQISKLPDVTGFLKCQPQVLKNMPVWYKIKSRKAKTLTQSRK